MRKRIETPEGPLLATDISNGHGSLYLTCFLNHDVSDEECAVLVQLVHDEAQKIRKAVMGS